MKTQTATPPAPPPRRPIVGLLMPDDFEHLRARAEAQRRELEALRDQIRGILAQWPPRSVD